MYPKCKKQSMGLVEDHLFIYQQSLKTTSKTKLPPVDLPGVVVIPGSMVNYWSSKLKFAALLLVLGMYAYFFFTIRAIYLKNKRLTHISNMIADTDKMIDNVHSMDQQLTMRVAKLDNLYENYY